MGDPCPTLVAFDGECAALTNVLDALNADDWNRPTNCPPWDLHELVVHIAFSIRIPNDPPIVSTATNATAADYYRRPERDTDAYRSDNVQRTQRAAGSVERGTAGELFSRTAVTTSGTLSRLDPDATLDSPNVRLRVDDYVLTRLMSVAAHGLDVAITLGREPWTTPEALSALRPVLVDLMGAEPPDAWTHVDLLTYGTGRRPLSTADEASLGRAADRFPLLS